MVDALAIETIAACAGLSSSRDLTEAQRGKITLPTRWGGALPGFGVAAPAQAVSSATVVEAYLKGLHNLERERDTLPWILSRIYDRFSNRSPAASPDETPSELALRADVDVINAAFSDPRVQVVLARTGDSDDPPGPDGAAEVAGPLAPENPLLEFSGLANGKRSSRLLSEFLWARDFVRLCGVASPLHRAKLHEGRLPGAALPYVLVPMTSAFSIDNAVYTRMLQNFLGITGHPLPHSHDCGHAGVVQLGEHNQHHIQVCPIYGRALKAHDEVKFLIAQMVRQCGVANVARTEVRLSGPAGNYDCDVVYFDRKTHERVVLEITRVAITQASISGSGVLAGPDAVLSILRARERERRRCARVSAIVEHDEGNTLFIPIVLTSCGGFGPSAQKYLKHIYGRARENNCSDMGVGQPDIQTTWNSLYASTYWNMRLSVAGAAKDAQVQNDILLSDFTRNLVVVGRQPHPDPNFASYVSSGRPHRLAVALPHAA